MQAKEFSDGIGLTWEDYGARMYDPQIGRWNTIDPHIENSLNWSPFAYTINNPMLYMDLAGADTTIAQNKTGNLIIWFNYDLVKIDYGKVMNQKTFDFIEVNSADRLQTAVKAYLENSGVSDLNTVVLKSDGNRNFIASSELGGWTVEQ